MRPLTRVSLKMDQNTDKFKAFSVDVVNACTWCVRSWACTPHPLNKSAGPRPAADPKRQRNQYKDDGAFRRMLTL